MTSRRAFLLGAVTALAAPAIVRASYLMPLYVPPQKIVSWGPMLNQNGLEIAWSAAEDFAAWRPETMLLEAVIQYAIPAEAFKIYARTAGTELFHE